MRSYASHVSVRPAVTTACGVSVRPALARRISCQIKAMNDRCAALGFCAAGNSKPAPSMARPNLFSGD